MPPTKTRFGFELPYSDFRGFSVEERDSFLNTLITESNLIEGIITDELETMSFEEGMSEEEMLDRAFPEVRGHLKAMDYVVANHHRNLTIKEINKIQGMVGKYLIRNPGKIRKEEVYVMSVKDDEVYFKGRPLARQIPSLMTSLEKKISSLDRKVSTEEIWNMHHEFEVIHPYVDGNGRTGRLLLNWLSLRYLNKFIVVTNDNKQEYYSAIQDFEEDFKARNPNILFKEDYSISKTKYLILKYFSPYEHQNL